MQRRRSGRCSPHAYQFMLSGFSYEKKVELCNKIRSLGAIYIESEHFQEKSTHIVCKRPSRSEKFLAGCASGKWLLVPEYIEDSCRHGRWLPESDYEWGLKWRHCVDKVTRQFLSAPRKWREKAVQMSQGPFVGWRVAVLVENRTKKMVYKTLLMLGHAYVESSSYTTKANSPCLSKKFLDDTDSLTHVFADETQEKLVEPLLKKGVFCLKPVYIGDFLIQEKPPDPHDYLVGKLSNKSQHIPESSANNKKKSPQNNHLSNINFHTSISQNKSTRSKKEIDMKLENNNDLVIVKIEAPKKFHSNIESSAVSMKVPNNTNRKRPSDGDKHGAVLEAQAPPKRQKLSQAKIITPRKGKKKISHDSPSLQKFNQSSIMSFLQVHKSPVPSEKVMKASSISNGEKHHHVNKKLSYSEPSKKPNCHKDKTIASKKSVEMKSEKKYPPISTENRCGTTAKVCATPSVQIDNIINVRNARVQLIFKNSQELLNIKDQEIHYGEKNHVHVSDSKVQIKQLSSHKNHIESIKSDQSMAEMKGEKICEQKIIIYYSPQKILDKSKTTVSTVRETLPLNKGRVTRRNLGNHTSNITEKSTKAVFTGQDTGTLSLNKDRVTRRSLGNPTSSITEKSVKAVFTGQDVETLSLNKDRVTRRSLGDPTSNITKKSVKAVFTAQDAETLSQSKGTRSRKSFSKPTSNIVQKSVKTVFAEQDNESKTKTLYSKTTTNVGKSKVSEIENKLNKNKSTSTFYDHSTGKGAPLISENCGAILPNINTYKKACNSVPPRKKNAVALCSVASVQLGNNVKTKTNGNSLKKHKSDLSCRFTRSSQPQTQELCKTHHEFVDKKSAVHEKTNKNLTATKMCQMAVENISINCTSKLSKSTAEKVVSSRNIYSSHLERNEKNNTCGNFDVECSVHSDDDSVSSVEKEDIKVASIEQNTFTRNINSNVVQGNCQTSNTQELTDTEKLTCALQCIKNQKLVKEMMVSSNGRNDDDVNLHTQFEKLKEEKGFPMSENYAAIYESSLEDGLLKPALNVITSSVCTTRYPQPKTLHSLLTDILQVTDSAVLAEKVYNVLMRILSLHPPHNAVMQAVYLKAMREPSVAETFTQGEEWNFLNTVIGNCINEAEYGEHNNNFLMLKFLVSLIDIDFKSFCYGKFCSKVKNTHQRSCLIWQILWPSGALAVGQVNTACQQLFLKLIDVITIQNQAKKVEMVDLLQTLIGVTANSCQYSDSTVIKSTMPSVKMTLFAKEYALKIRGNFDKHSDLKLVLTTVKSPLLLLLVCEHMLEFYDESLLPLLEDYDNNYLSLKKIVNKYFYLLPALISDSSITSHKKRKHDRTSRNISTQPLKKSEPLKVLADSNHVKDYSTRSKLNGNKSAGNVKKKVADVNKRNPKGETALHKACMSNNVTKIKQLLQTSGIDVNIKDYAGWTPLHEACNHGHMDALLELIKYRPAKNITSFFKKDHFDGRKLDLLACNDEGITPLHDAVENHHIHIVRILLQHGGKKILCAKTKDGELPVDLATTSEMIQLLKNPPANTVETTPTKRKYLPPSLQESSSQASQLLSQTILCNDISCQPPQETYSEILGNFDDQKHQYVAGDELQKYAVIVCYLLQSYLQVHDLINISNVCKQHDQKIIDLRSYLDNSETIFGANGSNNTNLLQKQQQLENSCNRNSNINKRLYCSQPSNSSQYSTSSVSGENDKALSLCVERLEDDMDVFSELKYHVRGFQSHLSLLSANGPQDMSVENSVKMYILVMRALHLS